MTPKLQSAEYAGGYRIRVRFADGWAGEVVSGPEPSPTQEVVVSAVGLLVLLAIPLAISVGWIA